MHDFDYQKVVSLKEAIEAISNSKGSSILMAGGTDLLIKLKEEMIRPARVIDLKGIHDIDGLAISENELSVGALTTMRVLETSPTVLAKAPLLAQAAAKLGSVQVRYRATIGGNLCNAAPSAETAPALLALDAKAEIYGKSGTRIVDLCDFFSGPGATTLGEGEILTSLKIPLNGNQQGAVYYKLSARKAMDIAFVGVAVLLEVETNGLIKKARIALGAVAPTPLRVLSAEKILEGKPFDAAAVEESARLAVQACQPISDIRASAEYRREMVGQLCRRGLFAAYHQAASVKEGEII
ncbi:MAG: xanthine dehydrogenase family protein subunit M [Pseudomonadota bacterium]